MHRMLQKLQEGKKQSTTQYQCKTFKVTVTSKVIFYWPPVTSCTKLQISLNFYASQYYQIISQNERKISKIVSHFDVVETWDENPHVRCYISYPQVFCPLQIDWSELFCRGLHAHQKESNSTVSCRWREVHNNYSLSRRPRINQFSLTQTHTLTQTHAEDIRATSCWATCWLTCSGSAYVLLCRPGSFCVTGSKPSCSQGSGEVQARHSDISGSMTRCPLVVENKSTTCKSQSELSTLC